MVEVRREEQVAINYKDKIQPNLHRSKLKSSLYLITNKLIKHWGNKQDGHRAVACEGTGGNASKQSFARMFLKLEEDL